MPKTAKTKKKVSKKKTKVVSKSKPVTTKVLVKGPIKISKNYRNDGTLLENEIGLESDNLLKNYWSFGFFGMLAGSAFEDQDLFRDDRAWIYKTEQFGYFGPKISTDRRKKLILGFNGGVGYAKLRGPGYRFSANSIYKPKDNLNIKIDFTQDLSPSRMQWVDIIEDGTNLSRVYAQTEQWTRKIDFRVDWTLSPDISFQGFFQPFRANMKYEDFFYLLEPNTMELDIYPYLPLWRIPALQQIKTLWRKADCVCKYLRLFWG